MMKEEVMDLWRLCFNDTEDFIHFYFDRKYQERNTLISKENGKTVSALQMLPYTMTWNSKIVPVSYISGASTHPDARKKGLMTRLLTEAFLLLKTRHIAFSILIPQNDQLYDYYSHSGYAPVFSYTPENYYLPVSYKHPQVEILTRETCTIHLRALYNYFNRQMLKRPYCVQHSAEDFRIILEDLYLSKGHLSIIRNPKGEITGMAFIVPFSDKVHINELLFDTEEEKSALLSTTANYWNKNEIELKTPARPGHTARRGMARIIDSLQVLQLYAATHPRKSLLIHLTDEQLPSNNGYYRLKNGQAFRTGSGVQHTDLDVNIRELTQIIFNYPAFISLMLD